MSAPSSYVHSLDTFVASFSRVLDADHALNLQEISILLAHLYRDKRAIDMTVDPKSNTTTIKFSAKAGKQPEPIEEHDSTVARLRTMLMDLANQIESLRRRADQCQETARNAVKAGASQKARALAALRSKKLAESTLSKREASSEQIERTLTSIDDAVGQKAMVSAMEASGKVIAELNRQIGGAERVDKVMDQLREGMADVEDINRMLGEAGAEGVDEAEVDEELEAMMNQKQAEDEQPRSDAQLGQLPSAPTTELDERAEEEVRNAKETLGRMSLDEPASQG